MGLCLQVTWSSRVQAAPQCCLFCPQSAAGWAGHRWSLRHCQPGWRALPCSSRELLPPLEPSGIICPLADGGAAWGAQGAQPRAAPSTAQFAPCRQPRAAGACTRQRWGARLCAGPGGGKHNKDWFTLHRCGKPERPGPTEPLALERVLQHRDELWQNPPSSLNYHPQNIITLTEGKLRHRMGTGRELQPVELCKCLPCAGQGGPRDAALHTQCQS